MLDRTGFLIYCDWPKNHVKNNRSSFFAPTVLLYALGLWTTAMGQEDARIQTNLPTLTQVDQIRRLSLQETERHYPIKLRGVVLGYESPSSTTLFISDDTGSISVRGARYQSLRQGQVVAITGVSGVERFTPMVAHSKIQVVGQSELPVAHEFSFQRVASGVDSQWVRVAGIVRSVAVNNPNGKPASADITLATEDGGRPYVIINDYRGEPLQPLVDAEVAVTGIAESIYNGKRQLINIRLIVPGMKFVDVRRAAPQDAWSAPPHSIASLRQFSLNEPSGHRVKVQGVITLQRPGELIFIRDETGSIRIWTGQSDPVSQGDHVEALGFPAVFNFAPVMEDAIFHKTGTGPPPQPANVSAREAQRGNHQAELIRVDAQLIDQYRAPNQLILVMQDGDTLFHIELRPSQTAGASFRTGARMRVTGICLPQAGNFGLPQTFLMNVRSPADLVVLRQPSWWTPERLRWALCILTCILLGAAIWVWTLRQQVNRQTRAIRDKIEREAALQERMRIAREFHDSLEQELASVRMQLELTSATIANAPETIAANLEMARTMICHSQAEARRSVWELRSQILENRTLPAALSASFRNVENGAPIEINVSGQTHSLPMQVESNLLRIAQEAIANAIHHAKPRHISINLAYEAAGARLRICDDGSGFCVEKAPDGQTGHFGLLGMKERADKMAGILCITSAPGKGTCVEVFVPQTENGANKA